MKRMIPTALVAVLCSLGLAMATGCVKSNRLSENWGRATLNNLNGQIINPDAGYQEPPTGLAPMSNRHVVENFDKNQASQSRRALGDDGRGPDIVIGEFD